MRPGLGALMLIMALSLAEAAAAQPMLRIDHAAARVLIIPEPRSDILIHVDPGRSGLPPLRSRTDGDVTVLDGGLVTGLGPFGFVMTTYCQGSGDRARVRVPGHGAIALQDLPVVTARVPQTVRIAAGPAVFGEIGRAEALEFSNAGCGDWRVGDVRGPIKLSLSGSGDLRGGAARDAIVRISGSSDVSLGAVSALLTRLSGSGDVRAARVDGPVSIHIVGSGDVLVDGGRATTLSVIIAGSGDLRFRGTAQSLSATIAGSGDVDVAHVAGPVIKRIAGSGEVNVGR
jgi:hypothetical protein